MFAKPRAKKSILPSLSRKRKNNSEVEEVRFDGEARQEYLTGFHKRKQQRIKCAQEAAVNRARLEKLETRKQVRNERRQEMDEHVRRVNEMLKASNAATAEEDKEYYDGQEDDWDGFPDKPDLNIVDHEEEYIDEDRFTTVTVETVSVSRDGLSKPELPYQDDSDEENVNKEEQNDDAAEDLQRRRTMRSRPKKKQFRYESKAERDFENQKQRARNIAKRRA
ncbi:hypothetical protein NQ176_g5565 [Zarea fungicola]|uniref:Uncharacterized protein n=1 Tax=Zarea fungicola TaxID=93591 RepID=A0ACC1N8E9_9HYPO|nr:hypothetical protein NQ176_g5565 [Lecanicillium fungicola]